MNMQKIFVGILSILNVCLFLYSILITILNPLWGVFLLIPPIIAGIILFRWAKKRKYDKLNTIKYFNIAYFGTFIFIFLWMMIYSLYWVLNTQSALKVGIK